MPMPINLPLADEFAFGNDNALALNLICLRYEIFDFKREDFCAFEIFYALFEFDVPKARRFHTMPSASS